MHVEFFEAEDHPLISKAHGLIETLHTKRNKVHEATERSDARRTDFFYRTEIHGVKSTKKYLQLTGNLSFWIINEKLLQ